MTITKNGHWRMILISFGKKRGSCAYLGMGESYILVDRLAYTTSAWQGIVSGQKIPNGSSSEISVLEMYQYLDTI